MLMGKLDSDSVYDDINKLLLFLRNPDHLKMHMATDLNVLCDIKPDALSILEMIVPPNIRSSKES